MSLLDAKRKEIYQILISYNGNKTKAAEKLGMSLRSLRDLTNNDPFFHEFKGDTDRYPTTQEKNTMANEIQKKETHEIQNSEIFDTREIVKDLHKLMNKVTENECTASTVNAACNASSQIVQ